jgi:acetate kinase
VSEAILALNAGSSSLKFSQFGIVGDGLTLVAHGQIEGIGAAPHLIVRDDHGCVLTDRRWRNGAAMTHEAFFSDLFAWIDDHLAGDELKGVGHRVVHGGVDFTGPAIVDEDVLRRLVALCPLAPLHQPHSISVIRAVKAARADLPQVATFDTAFHRTLPEVAARFALPRELEAEGVRRYGFHGLSYEYIARRIAELDPKLAEGRVIAAHLGNGASLCAMLAGVSVDTTMSFTAVDGLVMGTRCGTLDPGVILYLVQSHGFTGTQIEDLLYRRSGLLGVSGVSSDMRALLASQEPRAREAVELFVYQIARQVGALASSLGGLDGVVFTGGIGENAPEIRAAVCERLAWLDIALDPVANARNAQVISTPSSRVKVRVTPTDEERMIALHTLEALAATASAAPVTGTAAMSIDGVDVGAERPEVSGRSVSP